VISPPLSTSPASAADIPSVDRLLQRPAFEPLLARYGRELTTTAVRDHLERLRREALAGKLSGTALEDGTLASDVAAALAAAVQPRLRRVHNLTGTVLHTNLGRAVLPDAAVQAVSKAMTAPVSLEFDLVTGRRGERDAIVERLLCELTGAEAATVVNNNAAAVLLMLATLARRREVVISRGELIEIGGSFRIPDVMREAGAKLVEVGTTNRTHLSDYEDAIGPRTALLMKVHTSNFVVSGFTSSVATAELVQLGRARGLPVAVDLGSGTLVDLARWGLPPEPTVRDAVNAGADLVAFSGDKLLGGPQAGVLVGRADLIARLRRHPLKRALRVGKLTLAALEAVLTLYRSPDLLAERLTALRLLTRRPEAIRAQAARLQAAVQAAVGEAYVVTVEPMTSQIGSGALPAETLPSHGLVLRKTPGRRGSLERLDAALRSLPTPVLGRMAGKSLWLDLRCLAESDEADLAAQIATLAT
jgi:L-seryl-tRNA(Ser) seleniumtransferase